MLTPMRKLIMKMPDMAMIVCNQCMKDNEAKPDHEDYEVGITVVYQRKTSFFKFQDTYIAY